MPRQTAFSIVAFVAVVSISGCGGGKASVKGKVSYQGKPILMGSVLLVGPDGVTFTGNIEPDGSYVVEGVASGAVRVGVISRKPVGGNRGNPESDRPRRTTDGAASPRNLPPPPAELSKWFEIPAKYEEPTTSGLEKTIKSGENKDVNIDLP